MVPLVEQQLLTLPYHLSSPPVFSGIRVTRSIVLCVILCRSLFVLLSFFSWPLCFLSFFDVRFMDSDNPFGIFKIFLKIQKGESKIVIQRRTMQYHSWILEKMQREMNLNSLTCPKS